MRYEDAVIALVDTGLLAQPDVDVAVAILVSSPGELTYSGWTEALVQAGLFDQADAEEATTALANAGASET